MANETNKENKGTSLENLINLGAVYTQGKLIEVMKDTKKLKATLDARLRSAKERKSSLAAKNAVTATTEVKKEVEQEKVEQKVQKSVPSVEKIVENKVSNETAYPRQNQKQMNQDGSRQYNQNRPFNNNQRFDNRNGNNNYQRPQNGNYNNNFQNQRNNNGQGYQHPFNNKQGNGVNNQNRPFNNQNRPFNNQNRPFGNNNGYGNQNNNKPKSILPKGDTPIETLVVKDNKYSVNAKKTNYKSQYEEKKGKNKKQLLNYGYGDNNELDEFEGRVSSRKLKVKKEKQETFVSAPITKATITTDNITVKLLSESIGKPVAEIVKKLFLLGIMATINSQIDFTTAELVANELGIELEHKVEKTAEEQLSEQFKDSVKDNEEDLIRRPPVITVMGHVDHGKTSLLDAIKKTDVVATEAGGITQHIGAYTIRKDNNLITFIDTPGHAAFTAMRARGASITDIAVLVVAADDGIMPQTIEAINHIKAANVPMIVAINKMDKMEANPERIKQQLTEHGVVPEEWGGDTIIVPISAKSGQGIDKLLEMMLLLADIQDLKANPKRQAFGTVIEAKLDRGRGPVATILVQNGTLKIGNTVVCGTTMGKIRAMMDSTGKNIVSAGPSIAVSVLGFEDVPEAGSPVQAVDEKFCKQIIQERKVKQQLEKIKTSGGVSLDDFMSQTAETTVKTLNLIIKADVQGSLEALKSSLIALENEEVKVNMVHGGVGSLTETDILLAQASNAMVISFNIKNEAKVVNIAEKTGITVKNYNVIYQAIDDVTAMLKGMEAKKYKEVVIGHAEIRVVYKITGSGLIAGSHVIDGYIKRNAKARLIRGKEVIETTEIQNIKIFKDDAKEVREGFDCGIKIDCLFKEGDIIEAFIEEEIK